MWWIWSNVELGKVNVQSVLDSALRAMQILSSFVGMHNILFGMQISMLNFYFSIGFLIQKLPQKYKSIVHATKVQMKL